MFADARVGAVAQFVLLGGLLVTGAWFLLQPWPPRLLAASKFVVLGVACTAGLAYASFTREVRIDPVRREVSEHIRVLGIGRRDAWPVTQFSTVVVERRPAGGGNAYELVLHGSAPQLSLRRFEDALQAENGARAVAAAGSWNALRHGYRIESTVRDGTGLTAGTLEPFTTLDGKRGVSVSVQAPMRVVQGETLESPIDP